MSKFLIFRFLFFTTYILIYNFQFLFSVDPYKSTKKVKRSKSRMHKLKIWRPSSKGIKTERPAQSIHRRRGIEKESTLRREIGEEEKATGTPIIQKTFKKSENMGIKNLSGSKEIIEKLTERKEALEKAYKNMFETIQKNKQEIEKIGESEDKELVARKKMLLTYNKNHEKNLKRLEKNIEMFKKRIASVKTAVEILKDGKQDNEQLSDSQQKIFSELKKGFMRHKKRAAASMFTGGLAIGSIGGFGALISAGTALTGGLAAQVDFDQQLNQEEESSQLGLIGQNNSFFYQEDGGLLDKNNNLFYDGASDFGVDEELEEKSEFLELDKGERNKKKELDENVISNG